MAFDGSKGSVMLEFKRAATPAQTGDYLTDFEAAYAHAPTVSDVRKQFNLAEHEIQQDQGAIIPMVRPEGTTYIAVISMDAARRLELEKPDGFVQNWGNPPIGPC